MAIPKLYTLARMTTSTTGTGTITLGAAATVNSVTYLSFSAAGVADGEVVAYAIADTSNSEYGYGTYTAAGTTLTRNVIRSTNSNSAINLTGSAQVFITAGGSDLLWPMAPPSNLGISASVAGNALTIAIKDQYGADPSALSPVYFPVRSATDATGTPTWYAIRAATSLTISSGSTLGVANSVVSGITQTPFKIWLVIFDDAGTPRLGAIKCSVPTSSTPSIYALAAYGIASSTAEGGAGGADSAQVFYTGTAVTSKAYTTIGYLSYESGLATAGTWASAPTRTQIYEPSVPLPGRPTGGMSETIKTDTFTSTTAAAYTDITNFNAAITPTSASNFIKFSGTWHNIAGAANTAMTRVLRGSTALAVGDASSSRTQATSTIFRTTDALSVNCNSFVLYDFPSATSSQTYKVQFYLQGDTYYFNRTINDTDAGATPRLASVILLEELMG